MQNDTFEDSYELIEVYVPKYYKTQKISVPQNIAYTGI